MSTRTLPTIPVADVQSHSSAASCYVTVGSKVYDVTSFLDDHPGGAALVLEYAGRSVAEVLQDEASHAHSEAAYEMLDECFVGYVATDDAVDAAVRSRQPGDVLPLPPVRGAAPVFAATGMSNEEDLSKDTDFAADLRTHQFLDLSRPLFLQVWKGGFSKDFYLEQVHRPRHYRGGASAPLFGNFLEPLSLTPWWVVPAVWLPPIAYGTWLGVGRLGAAVAAAYCITGLCLWTLVEYGLHRCLFHLDGCVFFDQGESASGRG